MKDIYNIGCEIMERKQYDKFKKVGNKNYKLYTVSPFKSTAAEIGKTMKSRGYLVRTVKVYGGYATYLKK